MADQSANAPWVCGRCRSVNNPRSGRCYSCHTPRDVSEVAPDAMPTYGKVEDRPDAPIPIYQDSSTRATLATVAILLVAGIAFIAQLAGEAELRRVLAEGIALDPFVPDDPFAEPTPTPIPAPAPMPTGGLGSNPLLPLVLGGSLLVTGALALLAWAAWLSRVVDNLPALGVGYGAVSPRAAFWENVIPLYNLARVPAILRDVFKRLDKTGLGDFLIAVSWLCLVGSLLLGRFAAQFVSFFSTIGESGYIDAVVVAVQVAAGIGLTGALVLIGIIWRIERLAERRLAEVQGGPPGAGAGSGSTPASSRSGSATPPGSPPGPPPGPSVGPGSRAGLTDLATAQG